MIADLSDVTKQVLSGKGGRGGRRPGSGRPRKDGKPKANQPPIESPVEVRSVEALLTDGPPDSLLPPADIEDTGAIDFRVPDDPVALFAGAKARKEAALAAKAELDFRVKAGQYVPRDAVRDAQAKAFQSIAQTMRSIPDNLERKLGLDPVAAESVGALIDAALGDLAETLEEIYLANYESSNAS